MKKNLLLLLFLSFVIGASAQQMLTYEYALKDTQHLLMDVYVPKEQNPEHSCMIFVFGGGYIEGARNDKQIVPLQKYYTEKGWVVISIDYRLGLKGFSNYSVISGIKKFDNAISMAAEDLISATDYILKNLLNTPQFSIDPKHIVTIGSSAGAITVLQADYFLGNRIHGTELLPDTFRYAGVMPFAGGIFSHKGKIKYTKQAPAPTLFCHGIEDRLVPYNKITFCNLGIHGSSDIVKQFKKNGYPYHIRRYVDLGHEVAIAYMFQFDVIDKFLEEMVFGGQKLQIDETYYNPAAPKHPFGRSRIRDLKKVGK